MQVTGESTRRWNVGRDAVAAVLLYAALLLPWNLYFGLGIANSRTRLFAVLALATAFALGSIAATYVGPRRISGPRPDPVLIGRLRLALGGPYLLLVCGVVVFDVIQTVRYGGSPRPPGGVGPGAWLGIAGALLAAQPVVTDDGVDTARFGRWVRSARILGYLAMIGAGFSVLFNLYWRIRYALPGQAGAAGFGGQHVAMIATAVVYGAVAWAAVFVASRWILQHGKPAQIATVTLGGSTLVAGLLVWILPVGRMIDGFHGIAQNTSTAGVGFEGYLVWAATAACFVAPALHNSPDARSAEHWLAATRKTLALITVWCLGSALMRITDLLVAVDLDLPYSPYDSAAMAAFDLITAVVAVWVRINLINRSLPTAAIWSMCAVLFGFTIARVVAGVGLAPRLADAPRAAALAHPVYGNGLAQQITSTFDVVLCGLALCAFMVAIVAGRLLRPAAGGTAQKSGDADRSSSPRIFRSEDETRRLPVGGPKIYRSADDSEHHDGHEP